MARDFTISYEWYSKDWATNEDVMELNLSERGVYRELIDKAYKTGNCIPINYKLWARVWNCTCKELEKITKHLHSKGLIDVSDKTIKIPSVGKRLDTYYLKSRVGKEGGLSSAQARAQATAQPTGQPTGQPNRNSNRNRNSNIEVPTFEDFYTYAKSKEQLISQKHLKHKYDSWVENGWKDGNDKPIKNWKSKLNNTIPYIQKEKTRTW